MKLRLVYEVGLLLAGSSVLFANTYLQTNLVSNTPGNAVTTDPNLVDPWGMSFSATSPFWISDRGTGLSTLYNGSGAITPLVVTVPPGTAATGPTGQVFAGPTTTFQLAGKSTSFIFDTLGGTIDAWNGGATATVVATTAGARYEGLALANNTLYAANFASGGGINVFNSSYSPTALAGNFTDPNLPAGYAPFNIQNINGQLFVEYAQVNANSAIPVPASGNGGFVDIYSTTGTLLDRLISGGPLDAPWGIALAPANFGSFSNDLLVGNFGNGEINAFDPTTGAWLGTLDDSSGNPIVDPGLWALDFGNSSANTNALYFTSGPDNGNGGLFGEIVAVPEPGALTTSILGLLAVSGYLARKRIYS